MRVENVADVVEMADENLDSAAASIQDLPPAAAAVYRSGSVHAVHVPSGESSTPPGAASLPQKEGSNTREKEEKGGLMAGGKDIGT